MGSVHHKSCIEGIKIYKGSPSYLSIFFFSSLAVAPEVLPLSGCIISTRYLFRNLRIWWRVRTYFDDFIISCFWQYIQGEIYWVLRAQIIPYPTQLHQKLPFSKLQGCFIFSLARSFQRANTKSGILKRIRFNSVFDTLTIALGHLYIWRNSVWTEIQSSRWHKRSIIGNRIRAYLW